MNCWNYSGISEEFQRFYLFQLFSSHFPWLQWNSTGIPPEWWKGFLVGTLWSHVLMPEQQLSCSSIPTIFATIFENIFDLNNIRKHIKQQVLSKSTVVKFWLVVLNLLKISNKGEIPINRFTKAIISRNFIKTWYNHLFFDNFYFCIQKIDILVLSFLSCLIMTDLSAKSDNWQQIYKETSLRINSCCL